MIIKYTDYHIGLGLLLVGFLGFGYATAPKTKGADLDFSFKIEDALPHSVYDDEPLSDCGSEDTYYAGCNKGPADVSCASSLRDAGKCLISPATTTIRSINKYFRKEKADFIVNDRIVVWESRCIGLVDNFPIRCGKIVADLMTLEKKIINSEILNYPLYGVDKYIYYRKEIEKNYTRLRMLIANLGRTMPPFSSFGPRLPISNDGAPLEPEVDPVVVKKLIAINSPKTRLIFLKLVCLHLQIEHDYMEAIHIFALVMQTKLGYTKPVDPTEAPKLAAEYGTVPCTTKILATCEPLTDVNVDHITLFCDLIGAAGLLKTVLPYISVAVGTFATNTTRNTLFVYTKTISTLLAIAQTSSKFQAGMKHINDTVKSRLRDGLEHCRNELEKLTVPYFNRLELTARAITPADILIHCYNALTDFSRKSDITPIGYDLMCRWLEAKQWDETYTSSNGRKIMSFFVGFREISSDDVPRETSSLYCSKLYRRFLRYRLYQRPIKSRHARLLAQRATTWIEERAKELLSLETEELNKLLVGLRGEKVPRFTKTLGETYPYQELNLEAILALGKGAKITRIIDDERVGKEHREQVKAIKARRKQEAKGTAADEAIQKKLVKRAKNIVRKASNPAPA
ncbi:hypothetical protein NEHOM01_0453 [Nematocida homosporus]|uniref:uncharacterized protein n=1 Tax=Nematocida homosporus TaxID=1912981 RepID=UPI002220F33B|nr:uncharacterized protein NEHOM01_0453 [Nematocida homosporus]KAI5184902.1 hypothetical protein NEHOM01_0453 [Nematocida homosporus]